MKLVVVKRTEVSNITDYVGRPRDTRCKVSDVFG